MYKHAYIHTYIHPYICMYMYVCMHVYLYKAYPAFSSFNALFDKSNGETCRCIFNLIKMWVRKASEKEQSMISLKQLYLNLGSMNCGKL